jgi:hypothetical protein
MTTLVMQDSQMITACSFREKPTDFNLRYSIDFSVFWLTFHHSENDQGPNHWVHIIPAEIQEFGGHKNTMIFSHGPMFLARAACGRRVLNASLNASVRISTKFAASDLSENEVKTLSQTLGRLSKSQSGSQSNSDWR